MLSACWRSPAIRFSAVGVGQPLTDPPALRRLVFAGEAIVDLRVPALPQFMADVTGFPSA